MEDRRLQRELAKVSTPCYVVDKQALISNLEILKEVKEKAGCRILLALKAYSMWRTFPLINQYLDGVCASSPNEARLGREEFGKEVHTYSPAYSEKDFKEILRYSDHIVFNSVAQWKRFRHLCKGKECGFRVNPGYSEVKVKLYDPCSDGSRLGIRELKEEDMEGIRGLHFHAMCEQDSDTLERVLASFEKKFGHLISKVRWVNFGGGHHITRKGYDRERLIRLVKDFKKKHGVEVILEPGEAIALDAGYLVSTVLDVIEGRKAILDTSAEAHMPDVLAMPYRPQAAGAGKPEEKKHTYKLGGNTCLAGDVIGDYSFDDELKVGDKVIFKDMAIYSMVKNTTFNGVGLPSIAILDNGKAKILKRFTYKDFKSRV